MAHAAQTSLFCRRFEKVLDSLSQNLRVVCVRELPLKVREDMNCNAKKLEHCSGFLDEDEQHLIISMLNGSWSDDLSQKAELTHVCSAGCCRDRQESVQKVKKALQIALRMCATPLLYRWKHVSPMAEMVLRGLLIHNLWPYVWRECMREKHDVEVEIPETADDPNLSPAEAQKIRSAKVLQMLESPDCIASFARAVLLVRPLRLYVDFVSLVETVRLHRRLRRKGLLVAGSGTRHDENDLVHMNLQLVTGRRGLQVCVDFLELLRASPDQEENQWNAEVNLDHDSTVPSVLMAMCDAFRRLHACFLGLPWQLFQVVEMDAEPGIAHMRHLRQSSGACSACRDRLFAEVSCQHLRAKALPGS